MFSVIIPTLFKSEILYKTLFNLSNCEWVGEIILIDNSKNQKPFGLKKLNHLVQGDNIFVNPAWNLGVKNAKFDKICILNDDIFFDWDRLEEIEKLITSDIGFIGLSKDNYNVDKDMDLTFTRPNPDGKTQRGQRPEFWGTCIFFHKDNWDPIPENLRVWAGDDWLFYRSKKQNLILNGLKCSGSHSTTIESLSIDDILRQDMLNMKDYVKKGLLENYLLYTIWWQ